MGIEVVGWRRPRRALFGPEEATET